MLKQICFEREVLLPDTAKLGWITNFLVSLWLWIDLRRLTNVFVIGLGFV